MLFFFFELQRNELHSGECKNAKASLLCNIAASTEVAYLQSENHSKLWICKNISKLLKVNLNVWLFPRVLFWQIRAFDKLRNESIQLKKTNINEKKVHIWTYIHVYACIVLAHLNVLFLVESLLPRLALLWSMSPVSTSVSPSEKFLFSASMSRPSS